MKESENVAKQELKNHPFLTNKFTRKPKKLDISSHNVHESIN